MLTFLNVLLEHHSDGNVSTSVYRKPTHINKHLEFTSHHPLQHKVSVVRTLFARASILSSSLLQQRAEELVVSKALRPNGYLERIIQQRNRFQHCVAGQPSSRSTDNDTVTTISIPYIQGLSEGLRRLLSNLNIRVSIYLTAPCGRCWLSQKTQFCLTVAVALSTRLVARVVLSPILVRVVDHCYSSGHKKVIILYSFTITL